MKELLNVTIKEISALPNNDGYNVTFSDGTAGKLSKKAMWSWGRIQGGRKAFDETVKSIKEDCLLQWTNGEMENATTKQQIQASKIAIMGAFGQVRGAIREDHLEERPVQAFIDTLKMRPVVVSIATRIHSILSRETVMEIGNKVFEEQGISEYSTHSGVVRPDQLLGLYDKSSIDAHGDQMNIGINFSAGDIYTQRAIFVGQMIELQVCTNPIIWARRMLSAYLSGTRLSWHARILRLTQIESEGILKTRIETLVKEVQSGKRGLVQLVRDSRQKFISGAMADAIIRAIGGSYGIGKKVTNEIWEEFMESNGKSLYDLAQATSHISWSSQQFRADVKVARNILTGISAVLLTIDDPKKAYELSKQKLEVRQR